MRSLAVGLVIRVLRLVPGVLIAVVIVSIGLGVRDFFAKTTNQFIEVQSAIAVGGK